MIFIVVFWDAVPDDGEAVLNRDNMDMLRELSLLC